jgi:hypothetical protein
MGKLKLPTTRILRQAGWGVNLDHKYLAEGIEGLL